MRTLRWLAPLLVGALLLGSCNGPQAVVPEGGAALSAAPADGWDLLVAEANVNGALWLSGEAFKVGTGVINPFLGIQKKDVQQGFNTDGKFRYDQTRSNFTDALPLNVVSQIEVEGVWYRELILDANEANASPAAQFSIDEFELWLCATPAAATYEYYDDFATNETECRKVYDFRDPMLTGTPKVGYASDANTQGSGSDLDYLILIPESLFGASGCYYNPAANCGVYLILWTKMGGVGGDWVVGSTFEEFSTLVREVPTGFKAGVKYHDLNGNGERDEGEPGLEGWTIELWRDGAKIAETTTDADGAYLFADLLPGDYTAKEVCPEGWLQSEPVPAGGCGSGVHDFSVFPGQLEHPDNDFGNYLPASKSGTKFNDLNANGVWDAGEPGLPDWTIELWQGGSVVATTATDATGAYGFTGLTPGDYLVCEVQQAGWTQSFPDPATLGGCWSVTLASGEDDTGNDFGNYESVSVTACKLEDVDGDPNTTSDQVPVAGWTVELTRNGEVIDTGTTGADGCFTWTNLEPLAPPSYYDVHEVVADGWFAHAPTGVVCEPIPSGGTCTVTFVNSQYASKSGHKWHDLNGNGVWDPGEPGLSGWQIVLTWADGVLWMTTDAEGAYAFDFLVPGVPYQVFEAEPNTFDSEQPDPVGLWVQTFPTLGPLFWFNGTVGYDVLLASGEVHTDNDFGNWMPPMNDETAWAANELGVPGTLPYNPGGTGDWATYVAYAPDKTVTLYAGRTIDVGTVEFSAPTDGMVDITITLTGGWQFFGDVDNVMVQDYAIAPSGNPSPGLFAWKAIASGTSHTITVPENAFYGVHAVVVEAY